MSMVIQGIELTDQQMAAINPVINQYSKKARIDVKKMEADCLEAMQAAGCPLQVDPPAQ